MKSLVKEVKIHGEKKIKNLRERENKIKGTDKNIEQANLREVRMNKVKRWNSTEVGWGRKNK